MPTDVVVRATAADGHIRMLAARTTSLAESARRRHDLYPVAAAALGRTLTGALLLAQTLKDTEHLTLRLLGNGPLGVVVADADGRGRVRGYVGEPHVLLPLKPNGKLDVGRAVGHEGTISVARDLGLRGPYSSSAPLVSGEVAEDLAHYLRTSEQTPSAVALGVLVGQNQHVTAAGGLLVQLMPGGAAYAEALEAGVARLGAISERLQQGMGPEDLLAIVAEGLSLRIHEHVPVRFACRCSAARVKRALLLLPEGDLVRMREEDEGAELTCHFCGRVYEVEKEELDAIIERQRKARS